MIKLIVFDLDGVLVDSRELHYEALNRALYEVDPKYVINRDEHLSTYDGLPTTAKLNMLNRFKGLPKDKFDQIWSQKQKFTSDIINNEYVYDERLRTVLQTLKQLGYTIYVASNSIYNTIKMMLLRKGLLEYIDFFISNEDVINCKPSGEIYLRCLIRANVTGKETIVVEDSHIGRKSAINAGCHLLPVENPDHVSLDKILKFINDINKMEKLGSSKQNQPWLGKINVVIPMAGAGSRFAQVGYTFPKPLIDVNGKPMIQVVVDNLNLSKDNAHFVYIVQKSHFTQYNLHYFLNLITPNCTIIPIEHVTEGAACSVLLAKEHINNDEHLLIVNSDQFLEWDSNGFMYAMDNPEIDAGISTFDNTHPKWSYAKLDDTTGYVCEVAEKKPISQHATTGIYYWKHGSDFVKYAEQMISKNIRVNNEFYVCPVFNEAILDNKKIKIMDCKKMWGLGTPEDLTYFLNNYKSQ